MVIGFLKAEMMAKQMNVEKKLITSDFEHYASIRI